MHDQWIGKPDVLEWDGTNGAKGSSYKLKGTVIE